MSQGAVAERLGVSQALVSNWEREKQKPNSMQSRQLKSLFESVPTESQEEFSEWLLQARQQAGLSRAQLASKSGVSQPQIANIETGVSRNPRETTRSALEKALDAETPASVVEAADRSSEIEGVGKMKDFDPHSDDQFPTSPGIYVLYDVSDRPIYIGKSSNIRRRLREHTEKFWYRSPIVEKASFVQVDDEVLRGQLEETLIKFLKSNAVVNQQHVDR